MQPHTRITLLAALLFVVLNSQLSFAQTKADIFDGKTPITWLGLDYTQARLIGSAADYQNAGSVLTSADISKIYAPAWNDLFITEPKKYSVAKAMHRSKVAYALNVTENANRTIKKDFFTKSPSDFKTLTEQNISDLIKGYDFQGKTGIGMLFFVEGFSKADGKEGAWITFVDMSSKTLLFTTYLTGKTAGMGFRNNWADPIFWILEQLGADPIWKKQM